jgi:hypothetical protein
VQTHHQVGPDAAGVGVPADLLGEVAVLQHSGGLDDAAQLMLAPPAAHLRCPQRRDQLAGFDPELAGHL